jgi:hypothetical protein
LPENASRRRDVTAALGPIGFTIGRECTDSVTGSLRWNHGVHNFMTYITGDIPVGAYDSHADVAFGTADPR